MMAALFCAFKHSISRSNDLASSLAQKSNENSLHAEVRN